MPRGSRIRLPGLPLHIVQRGINRSQCFFSDTDRMVYLAVLERWAKTMDCAIHAYVLMTNHVHLLATPTARDGVSSLMRNLGQHYVQYFNRTHRRTGALWEGRYRASFVESSDYVLACYRYIELNPARAGMVQSPADYPWSSHRTNALGEASSIITPHPIFQRLAPTGGLRRETYRSLFAGALGANVLAELRERTNANRPIGSEDFVAALEGQTGRRMRRLRPGPQPQDHSAAIAPSRNLWS